MRESEKLEILAACRANPRLIMDTIEGQLAKIDRLQAIVDKFPHTADGVPVVPGMQVWIREPGKFCSGRVFSVITDGPFSVKGNLYEAAEVFSTREAADSVED